PLLVLVRDLERVIKIVLRLAFYSSPVLYSHDRLPDSWQWVYVANPLSPLLSFYRSGIFPDLLSWSTFGISALTSTVIFCVGWFIFIRLERTVLKEI
ncbi:MAG: ABC transporter permease, partial [Nocardioidaceae bacterium]